MNMVIVVIMAFIVIMVMVASGFYCYCGCGGCYGYCNFYNSKQYFLVLLLYLHYT